MSLPSGPSLPGDPSNVCNITREQFDAIHADQRVVDISNVHIERLNSEGIPLPLQLEFHDIPVYRWKDRIKQYAEYYKLSRYEIKYIQNKLHCEYLEKYGKNPQKRVTGFNVPDFIPEGVAENNPDPEHVEETLPEVELSVGGHPDTARGGMSNAAVPTPSTSASTGSSRRQGRVEVVDPKGGNNIPGSASGNHSEGTEPTISRPISESGGFAIFKQVHRIYTYGLEEKIISKNNVNTNFKDYYLVTGLCDIPWHRVFFYLNPNEYASLPIGSKVSEVGIKIWFRNCRQSFETNSTESNLASLNQAVNIQSGVGLNKSIKGLNGKVTTDVSLMIKDFTPIGTSPTSYYKDLDEEFYGVNEQDANFILKIPRSQIGSVARPESYYAMYHNNQNFYTYKNAADTTVQASMRMGWPRLQEHISLIDSNSASGKMILAKTYKPIMGFIKKPYDSLTIHNQMAISTTSKNGTIEYMTGTHMRHSGCVETNITQSGRVTNTVPKGIACINCYSPKDDDFSRFSLIENSQTHTYYQHPSIIPQTMPSIHVGLKPAESTSLGGERKISNMQGLFEIETTMKVDFGFPMYYPHHEQPHILPEATFFVDGNKRIKTNLTMHNGLYRYA
uniref:Putative structural protein n=1 Tax=Lanius cristatus ambidensovirus TaxID=2794461 RepID=A0A8A4XEN9_9VIRU|nr:MAG: putative structural protein [Lanius cristatus ambidensovirus]